MICLTGWLRMPTVVQVLKLPGSMPTSADAGKSETATAASMLSLWKGGQFVRQSITLASHADCPVPAKIHYFIYSTSMHVDSPMLVFLDLSIAFTVVASVPEPSLS
ncbi:unnamed protein product [Urochloa humidicola]